MPLELLARIPPIVQALIEAGSGPILTPCSLRCRLTMAADRARLHANLAPAVLDGDVAPRLRDHDQQPVRHRLPGQAGAGGPEGQRDPVLPAETEQGADLVHRVGPHDGSRHESVDAGVAGVSDAVDVPREHPIGFEDAGQLPR